MNSFDVIVIGGGPAGMMAAVRASQMGASVLLLEKNEELGRKLSLTGRGRCNIAHDVADPIELAEGYGEGKEFMEKALKRFGLVETVKFFESRGMPLSHERGKRLYPRSGQDSGSVLALLRRCLRENRVLVLSSTEVKGIDVAGGKIRRVITRQGEIDGRAFVVATGGLSFPATGSTGDGYRWARKFGCRVEEPRPAICPIECKERFCSELNGLKLKNVRLTLLQEDRPVAERFGEMDFAPFGVTGATAMDMAAEIGDRLSSGKLRLRIDLKPALDDERFEARIDRDFEASGDLPLRFALRKMLPKEIIPVVLRLAGLEEGRPCGATTSEERHALRRGIKEFSVTPIKLMGFRWAIVTRGGVKRDDLNPLTMASLSIPNLYFAGEVIDVNGPTGGYNLQICWTTGWIAGQAAAAELGYRTPVEAPIQRPKPQRSPTAEWRGHLGPGWKRTAKKSETPPDRHDKKSWSRSTGVRPKAGSPEAARPSPSSAGRRSESSPNALRSSDARWQDNRSTVHQKASRTEMSPKSGKSETNGTRHRGSTLSDRKRGKDMTRRSDDFAGWKGVLSDDDGTRS